MILPRFDICPIYSRFGKSTGWKKVNYNPNYCELECLSYLEEGYYCCFSQYSNSFEDKELEFFDFFLPNYKVFVYSDNFCKENVDSKSLSLRGQTYFYHRQPSRNINDEPFLILNQFPIDWGNLDKLNDKLNKLKIFK
jgi:hypothetical protein